MKRILISLMAMGCLLCAGPVFAVPTLQLDISDGVYDTASQSVFSTNKEFTLYALLDPGALASTGDFYISAAITPKVSGSSDLGTFRFAGASYNVTDDMNFGTPSLGGVSLPEHGIFDTYYKQFAFSFVPELTSVKYNVEDSPGGFAGGDALYYRAFSVDVTGLAEGYELHFDLYGVGDNGKFIKAPFSHDAQSGGIPVPEPSTLLLFGAGMVGVSVYYRKRGNR